MAKVLSLQDLMNRKMSEMSGEDIAGLYDLIIPLGVPQSIIIDMAEMFDLDVTDRVLPSQDPDLGEAKVIVMRGPLDVVQKAEAFMREEVAKWMDA